MTGWIYQKQDTTNTLDWLITLPNGEQIEWTGLTSGPLNLSKHEVEQLCQQLLHISSAELGTVATKALQPVIAPNTIDKSLVLHSATSDLGAFEGDFAFLQQGKRPKNYAGYVETRAVYLGKTNDLSVGRMSSWKNGMNRSTLQAIEVPNLEYYYLSHYLLKLAATHVTQPNEALEKIIAYLKENPTTTIRLYVLDTPIQIFLTWLQRITGLDKIYIDANSPDVSRVWNNKNILYPTVTAALQLKIEPTDNVEHILKKERTQSLLYTALNLELETLPGYVIERKGKTLTEFSQQLLQAAQLLQARYGLTYACLKAGEAGDGGRITPNVDLKDTDTLQSLAVTNYKYGDDYVLECHFHYASVPIGKDMVNLTPSAHIRSGQVAPGITLQFKRGNSWMGNLFVDEKLTSKVGITISNYRMIQTTIQSFLNAFQARSMGLTIAGIDFAIGHIGGKFGNQQRIAIQDPNISFNGAEFLRVFMEKASPKLEKPLQQIYALTWVFVPSLNCTYSIIDQVFEAIVTNSNYCETIALVPNSWGMIGISSTSYEACIQQWEVLKQKMSKYCL